MKKLLPLCFLVLWACSERDPSTVEDGRNSETSESEDIHNNNLEATLYCDSLLTEIDQRDSTIHYLNNPPSSTKSAGVEEFCSTLANDLLTALNTIDEDPFLSHFGNAYSVNWVDVRNQAQIARYTHEDFRKEFKRLLRKDKKLDLKLHSFEFLSSDVKGELFNATFKISITESGKNENGYRNATMSLVGRKKGSYKIANLNVYVFDHES